MFLSIINLILTLVLPGASVSSPEQYFPVYNDTGQVEQQVYFGPERDLASRSLGPKISSRSAVVVDKKSNKILLAKNISEQQPIASLTKLMTALVFLETKPDWQRLVTYTKEEEAIGARLRLNYGEQVTVADLLPAALIGSTNNGVRLLVKSTGLSEEEFTQRMNKKAQALGLLSTYFVEPTGLSDYNRSSVEDYWRLMQAAFLQPEIKQALTQKEYDFITINTHRAIKVKNTDLLLKSYLDIAGGKTGYIDEAGFCLAVEVKNDQGKELYVIVLGAQDSATRFQEVKALSTWAFENYNI